MMLQVAIDFTAPNPAELASAMSRVAGNRAQFRPEFPRWLAENWGIWREFERRASRLWHSGRRHYSARTIIEAIRFDTALAEQDGLFKVNNNIVPDLARLYLLFYPERSGFFEMRHIPGMARAA